MTISALLLATVPLLAPGMFDADAADDWSYVPAPRRSLETETLPCGKATCELRGQAATFFFKR